MAFPLMSAPKPKYKSIWLSGCANYEGYILNKVPEGDGKLTVYNYQDVQIKDVITGNFVNNIVSDATLTFAGGLKYKGDLELNIKPDGIDYTLSKGYIEVYHHIHKQDGDYLGDGYSFELTAEHGRYTLHVDTLRVDIKSQVISRKYNGFDIKNGEWVTTYQTNKLSDVSKAFIRDFNLYFKDYTNISESYKLTIRLNNKDCDFECDDSSFKLVTDDIEPVSYSKGTFELYNEKGRAFVKYANSFNGATYSSATLIERVFENGKITISTSIAGKEWQNHCSSENRNKLNKVRHYPPLAKELYVTSHCIQIDYKDGRIYKGKLFTEQKPTSMSYEIPNAITAILAYTELPQESYFVSGVLNYPDGKQDVYSGGHTLDAVIDYSIQYDMDEEARELARQKAQKEEEEKKQKEMDSLRNKYGKEYVDTIVNSNGKKILVGTPFELVQKLCSIKLDIDRGNSRCYYWYVDAIFSGKYKAGYFWVHDGKVTSVVYFDY